MKEIQEVKRRKAWAERVIELENEGLTTSDAQAVADIEAQKGLIEKDVYLIGGKI